VIDIIKRFFGGVDAHGNACPRYCFGRHVEDNTGCTDVRGCPYIRACVEAAVASMVRQGALKQFKAWIGKLSG
jgi:hypothetical protein